MKWWNKLKNTFKKMSGVKSDHSDLYGHCASLPGIPVDTPVCLHFDPQKGFLEVIPQDDEIDKVLSFPLNRISKIYQQDEVVFVHVAAPTKKQKLQRAMQSTDWFERTRLLAEAMREDTSLYFKPMQRHYLVINCKDQNEDFSIVPESPVETEDFLNKIKEKNQIENS